MAELGGEADLQEPRLSLASRSPGKPLGMTGYSAGGVETEIESFRQAPW